MSKCRSCGEILSKIFLDLGLNPIANNLPSTNQFNSEIDFYPLKVMTCDSCALVQLAIDLPKEMLFHPDYVYYSSFSSTWLEHSRAYAQKMIANLKLGRDDLVIEVASNDGYLLQFFAKENIQILGIEPAKEVANKAIKNGIPTLIEYFGESIAKQISQRNKPTLMIANNVLAHVPNLHDFISGFSSLIAENGVITFEFPHLVNLIKNTQFDTIYHEHYSYLSLYSLIPLFENYGLKVFNVEQIGTHGGSLRVFAAKIDSTWVVEDSVKEITRLELEYDPRLVTVSGPFQERVRLIKQELLTELNKLKNHGFKIAAYGAAAKGVTLLNYCNIDVNLIDYVIDLNPNKQGKFIAGLNIPIVDLSMLRKNTPDVLLILPWNLSIEIKSQLFDYYKSGLKMLRAIPKLEYV